MLTLSSISSENIQNKLWYLHASNFKNNLLGFEALLFIRKKRNVLSLRQVCLFLKKKISFNLSERVSTAGLI